MTRSAPNTAAVGLVGSALRVPKRRAQSKTARADDHGELVASRKPAHAVPNFQAPASTKKTAGQGAPGRTVEGTKG